MIYYDEGKRSVWWNSELDVTDWSLKGTGEMPIQKFNQNELWGYNFITQADGCYSAARTLELRFAVDPKDKILDQLIVRYLRSLANSLCEQGLSQLALNRREEELTDEEKAKQFKEVVLKSNG